MYQDRAKIIWARICAKLVEGSKHGQKSLAVGSDENLFEGGISQWAALCEVQFQIYQLEAAREDSLARVATKIQSVWRMHYIRKYYQTVRRASIKVQARMFCTPVNVTNPRRCETMDSSKALPSSEACKHKDPIW